MWGASMQDHEPPGRRRLSPHGWVYGVSSSEVRRSATRTTELYGVELSMQTFSNRTHSLAGQAPIVSGF